MKMTNEYKQNISANSVLVITCLSVVFGLAGCQQEGTAEKAGQKIDRAAESTEQNIEQATEKANQKIEAAKESLDQKADRAKESINESTAASKAELDKAEQKIDRKAENAELLIEKTTKNADQELKDANENAKTGKEYIDDSMIITMNVKEAILNDPSLKGSQIEVSTVNGVVKLSGTVDSEQNIGIAIGVANSQRNVKSVQTDLIVKSR
jgi:hyperosmotically inducible protein